MLEWLWMEHNSDLEEVVGAMGTIGDNKSWFRDTPHYWAEGWLPLAYAVACVEVVSKSSKSDLYSMQAHLDSTNTTRAETMSSLPFSLLE